MIFEHLTRIQEVGNPMQWAFFKNKHLLLFVDI